MNVTADVIIVDTISVIGHVAVRVSAIIVVATDMIPIGAHFHLRVGKVMDVAEVLDLTVILVSLILKIFVIMGNLQIGIHE